MFKRLHELLNKTIIAQNKTVFPLLKEYNITPGQPKILEYLNEVGKADKVTIAKDCDMELILLTNLLANMENSGILERVYNPTTGKSIDLKLTLKGEKAREKSRELFNLLQENSFRGMSDDDVQMFFKLMHKIYENSLEPVLNLRQE